YALEGGACGFGEDVANPPYNGIISAGNPFLYQSGKGCGSCYQVLCTENQYCSGKPVTVTITDECPGCDGNVHFDLSGKAFGYLAKPGQADKLRNAGKFNIQYQRVQCQYNVGITFKIDLGSNPYYLAFAIEFVSGDGDIGSVELSSPNSKGWLAMQQSFGATWKTQLNGIKGPYSVKVTTIESKKIIYVSNVIPANWAPGQKYHG
ncbi:putative expansin-b2, partial [Phtheirospermum japonicum]